MAKGAWSRHDDAHDRDDAREDGRTQRVIRESIEDLSTGKDMESDQDDIVG